MTKKAGALQGGRLLRVEEYNRVDEELGQQQNYRSPRTNRFDERFGCNMAIAAMAPKKRIIAKTAASIVIMFVLREDWFE
jgi:hypothetical protein